MYALKRTIGSWSGGTRVEIVDWEGSPSPYAMPAGMLEVRVLAGDNPIIEVAEDDVVKLRDKRPKVHEEDT